MYTVKTNFLTFIIMDEEEEEIHDPNMAPKVDYKIMVEKAWL